VDLQVDLQRGKMKLNDQEWVFRVDDDEWWKTHWPGKPDGSPESDKIITFMYKWLKVVDKHGRPTRHMAELSRRANAPLPHRNACEPWCACWPLCLSKQQRLQDMVYPAKRQLLAQRGSPAAKPMARN
jgi:hypothetical protein